MYRLIGLHRCFWKDEMRTRTSALLICALALVALGGCTDKDQKASVPTNISAPTNPIRDVKRMSGGIPPPPERPMGLCVFLIERVKGVSRRHRAVRPLLEGVSVDEERSSWTHTCVVSHLVSRPGLAHRTAPPARSWHSAPAIVGPAAAQIAIRMITMLSYVYVEADAQCRREGGSGREAIRGGSRHLGLTARRALSRPLVEAAEVR